MNFSYKQIDNNVLFSTLQDPTLTNIEKIQNFIPIYTLFFKAIDDTNCNNFNLDHTLSLHKVIQKETENKYNAILINDKMKQINKKVFFKFSPLLDYVKYMTGKYNQQKEDLFTLPSFYYEDDDEKTNNNNNNTTNNNNNKSKYELPHTKINNTNNSAYIDSFFTYLTSKLLNDYKFIHGIDFYGSFLAIKNDFYVNIYDDIEYMNESAFFRENKEELFTIDDENTNTNYEIILENLDIQNRYKKKTCDNNKKLCFNSDDNKIPITNIISLSDINDLTELDKILLTPTNNSNNNSNNNNSNNNNNNTELIYEIKPKPNNDTSKSISSSSSCSSRSSHTTLSLNNSDKSDDCNDCNDSDINSQDEYENSDDDGSDYDSDDESDDDELFVKIKHFPVNMFAMECCENTLDSHIMKNDISENEWDSIILQLLMILITFQKKFSFTHNDLHTNNIMYVNTTMEYVYYCINGVYYKVPTYGRIYKIIDFGRAIYKFKNQLLCSDSFHKNGDAGTQYNFEPYFNNKKPRLEPNYSFDLCRLGCALFDYIIDNDNNEDNINDDINKIKTPIFKIIAGWCKNDKGQNIMYKNTGEERYQDFKLYKMIARTVHAHIPENVLENVYFDKYIIKKSKIKKKHIILNIDDIPSFI